MRIRPPEERDTLCLKLLDLSVFLGLKPRLNLPKTYRNPPNSPKLRLWAGNTFESACHSCEISTSKMSRSGILRPLSRLASVATLVGILLYSRQEEATLISDNRSDPNNIDEPDPHCRTLLLYTVSPFSLFACNPIKACCSLDPHPLKSPSPKMYPPILYFPRKSTPTNCGT